MTLDTKYNGWTNHATWAVNLHLSNDYGAYDCVNELMEDSATIEAFTESIEEFTIEHMLGEQTPLASDLCTIGRVDWRDIAETWASETNESVFPQDEFIITNDTIGISESYFEDLEDVAADFANELSDNSESHSYGSNDVHIMATPYGRIAYASIEETNKETLYVAIGVLERDSYKMPWLD